MGGLFIRLEESKLRKPPPVEIRDDKEEEEEWDEKEKVKYKRIKQFEKLIVETMAMREKMENMQLTFCKAQGIGDYLYNMRGMSLKVPIASLIKFKIPDVEKFDGTRYLK